jgi:predicted nucleic acid-binding protein
MYLNKLRDRVGKFLDRIDKKKLTEDDIIKHIEKEIKILKRSKHDRRKYKHKIYDILYLVFELAAINRFDLDGEWKNGENKKRSLYVK